MNDAKKIIKERSIIEEKLTELEISYNKANYYKKNLIMQKKNIDKEINNYNSENLKKLETKISAKKVKLEKEETKLNSIKEKEYSDLNLKKANIFNQKIKIKTLKKDVKDLEKKYKKNSNLNIEKLNIKLNNLNIELNKIQPQIELKKEKVKDYRKQYKNINKQWKELFPEQDDSIAISVKNLDIFYGNKQAIYDVSINLPKNQIISIIGPSGCGKSTFLKTLNRINDEIPAFRAEGKILFQNEIDILTLANIYDSSQTLTLPELRTKIGMVFQQPNPFPMSIYNNVAYGPKINGIKNKAVLKEIVTSSLKSAALYEQVKDNLNALATGLSGGQQQRLCIARAIANKPDILLMDEPTSALDPIAAAKVEDLILELKKDYTIIMVTHSMQQAARISDKTAFFYQGELIEYGETKQIFTNPKEKRTDDYIRGKFG